MDDFIRRESAYPLAKKICDAVLSGEYGNPTLPHSAIMLPHFILDLIDAIPAADVRPVVRGKWVDAVQSCHDSPHVRCSMCGEYYWRYFNKFNFCPNCGADMREES